MMFGIIIVSIFIIFALLCFAVVIIALKENIKDKRRGKKPVFQANFMIGIGSIGFLFLAISLSVLVHTVSPYTNKEQNNSKCQDDTKTLYCNICGGKIECEICGDVDALYCEYASYGSGDDHYCQKHWSDVVEWHEKK